MGHDENDPHRPHGSRPPRPPEPPEPPRTEGPEIEDDSDWDRARTRRSRKERRRERKERVLHTRISEQLSDDIRRVADDLRVPVSNLVRNVLEETFGAVERVSEEVGDLLDEVLAGAEEASTDLRRAYRNYERRRDRRREREEGPGSRSRRPAWEDELDADDAAERESRPAGPRAAEPRPTPGRFGEVLGWQPLRVNQRSTCAGCERELRPGGEAFLGVTERGPGRTWLCPACMDDHGAAS